MNYSEVLQKYLLRIARGELLETSSVLPLVKSSKLFIPQLRKSDQNGIIKITFPIITKDGQKFIPVYLSRSNSASYSGTMTNLKSQLTSPIEMKGEELFSVLPKDFGIIIEPSSSLEVIFPREKLHNFITPSSENYKSYENNKTKDEQTSLQKDQLESPSLQVLSGGKKQQPTNTKIEEKILEKQSTEHDPSIHRTINEIENDLKEILEQFPAISEAYILEHVSPHSELILGVLANDWSGDERFRVIENVAILAKQLFGYAGAIEVYDDLHDTHSGSWDLFKMISPFYTQSNENKPSGLLSELEISSSKRGIRGSMSRLTKSSMKLFSSIASK